MKAPLSIALVAIVSLISLSPVPALSDPCTYYVNADAGNNSNPGNITEPLRDIQNAVSVAKSGDTICLRAGIHRDPFTVSKRDLTIEAYNSETVTVSGALRVTDWKPYSNKVYVADFAGPVGQVFVSGGTGEAAYRQRRLNLAQYPSLGYLQIDQQPSTPVNLSISSSALAAVRNRNLAGATVWIRTSPYTIDSKTITKFDPGSQTIFWDNATSPALRPITNGYGFYLTGQLWMLTTGEWFYDEGAKKLYVWLPNGGNPNDYIVEASTFPTLLHADGANGLHISGVKFDKATSNAIVIENSDGVHLDQIGVLNSGAGGVLLDHSPQFIMRDSQVHNIVFHGVYLKASADAQIRNNDFENVGTVGPPKSPPKPFPQTAAIYQEYDSDGALIIGNHITNVGYVGIMFRHKAIVQDNTIENACLVLTDCAGLYTIGRHEGMQAEPAFDSQVIRNVVSGVHAITAGMPAGTVRPAAGLYMDSLTNGVTVKNNVFARNMVGIYADYAFDNIIQGNLFYGNSKQLWMFEFADAHLTKAGWGPGSMKGNVVEANQFFPDGAAEAGPPIILQSGFDEDVRRFASFRGNTYSDRYSKAVVSIASKQRKTTIPLASWQGEGQDRDGRLDRNPTASSDLPRWKEQ